MNNKESDTASELTKQSGQKRAAAVGNYQEAFRRLMNDDIEGVHDLNAQAGAELHEAEDLRQDAASKGSKK